MCLKIKLPKNTLPNSTNSLKCITMWVWWGLFQKIKFLKLKTIKYHFSDSTKLKWKKHALGIPKLTRTAYKQTRIY